jgi:hypothetical protein
VGWDNLRPITPDPAKVSEYEAKRIEHVRSALDNVATGAAKSSVMEASDWR